MKENYDVNVKLTFADYNHVVSKILNDVNNAVIFTGNIHTNDENGSGYIMDRY